MLFTVSAVTMIFRTDFYDPFNSAKLILLLILDSWLVGHLLNSYRLKPVRFRTLEFTVTVLLLSFLVCLFMSTLMTDNFLVALIGDTQRRNGFLSYLGLVVIILFASRSLTFENIDRVYKIGILVGAILSTYGIIQISGKDFISWDNPYNSMISTLGNPNFAASMLAVLMLLGISSMMLKAISKPFKIMSIYLSVSALIAIIVSGSRQGLLVIFFSAIFYVSLFSLLRNRNIGLLVSSFSSICGIFAILGMLQKGPLAPLLYKDSVSVRGYYWRAGIEMFKDSPLVGIGVDRYGSYFKQFREASYPLKYGYEITSSNAHNTFIQLFATAGIFVGLLYLTIMFIIFFSGLLLIKQSDHEKRLIVLGLLSTWLGFQAQSLISIDNVGISIWGWLLGGSILGLKYSSAPSLAATYAHTQTSKKTNTVAINLFQPLISMVILIPTIFFSVMFYRAENTLFILKNISNPSFSENKQPVYEYVNKLIDNPIADPYYKYRSALFLYDMGFKEESYVITSNILRKDPKNPVFLTGKVFFEEARGNIAELISAREQISTVDPWNAANYLALLNLYFTNNDLDKAKEAQSKILKIAPGTEIAKTATRILN